MKIRRVNFSPDEYLAGTVRLSAVERGCYWTVCCLIYSHGGPVDDDPEWLAKACNCHGNTWLAVRRRLLDLGKLAALPATGAQSCGRLMNRRAGVELGAAETRVKHSAKASQTSVKKRRKARQKSRDLLKNNGLDSASAAKRFRAIKSHESLKESSLNQNLTGAARASRPAGDGQPARAPDKDLRAVGEVLADLGRKHRKPKP